MRGANSAIQLAAALDRRGVTASIHWEWVYVWLRDCEPIVIKPSTRVPTHEVGRMWAWDHNGNYWSHPRDDWEGVAEIVANYIAEDRSICCYCSTVACRSYGGPGARGRPATARSRTS